jgi:hypothetical protein
MFRDSQLPPKASRFTSKVGVHALRLTLWSGSIFAEADRLGEFPDIGHVDTRVDWEGAAYIIVYEINAADEEVVVLGIFHGAQAR